jgi:type IV pilus assembly protein PilF
VALCAAAFVLAAGCAQQPASAPVAVTAEESQRLEAARAHTELGAAYYGAGQLGIALEELTLASQIHPGYAPAYYMLGLVHMDLKEDKEAEAAFRRALALDPASSEAHNNYGWFLCQRGRIDEALREFTTALKNPRYETPEKAYVNAGICARKGNDEVAAVGYFEQALKIQPAHPLALYHLADIHFQRGDLATAKSLLLRYMKSNPPIANVLWLGVRVERRLGDREAEASYADMLRKRFPEAPETQLLKAQRYE